MDSYRNPYNKLLYSNRKIICDSCKGGMLLVFLVLSALQNKQKRIAIRETWGRQKDCIKVRFFVGLTNDTTVKRSIREESAKYKDIIRGRFPDTYKNLVFKHIFALKWAAKYCKNGAYFIRIDDDVMVNMELLYDKLEGKYWNDTKLISCRVYHGTSVIRNKKSKWAVSKKEYAGDMYPDYCQGAFVIYSADVVHSLCRAASKAPPFWLEDVYITGILARRLGLKHFNIANWYLEMAINLNERSYYRH